MFLVTFTLIRSVVEYFISSIFFKVCSDNASIFPFTCNDGVVTKTAVFLDESITFEIVFF